MNRINDPKKYFAELSRVQMLPIITSAPLDIIIATRDINSAPTRWETEGNIVYKGYGMVKIHEIGEKRASGTVLDEFSYHCKPQENGRFIRFDLECGDSSPHINTSNPEENHLREADSGLLLSELNALSAINIFLAFLKGNMWPLDNVDKVNKIITKWRI